MTINSSVPSVEHHCTEDEAWLCLNATCLLFFIQLSFKHQTTSIYQTNKQTNEAVIIFITASFVCLFVCFVG